MSDDTMHQGDDFPLFDVSSLNAEQPDDRIMFHYYLKLSNGDSVIARSHYDEAQIDSEGRLCVFEAMAVKTFRIPRQDGSIIEVMNLTPWMELSNLGEDVFVPIESIVGISTPKQELIDAYGQQVLRTYLKDLVDMNQARDPKATAEDAVVTAKGLVQSILGGGEGGAIYNPEDPYAHAKPRKPELLDRDGMIEAELEGDIELSAESTEDTSLESWQVNGVTIH